MTKAIRSLLLLLLDKVFFGGRQFLLGKHDRRASQRLFQLGGKLNFGGAAHRETLGLDRLEHARSLAEHVQLLEERLNSIFKHPSD